MAALGPCEATIVALSNVTAGVFTRMDNAATIYALLDAQNRAVGEAPDPTGGRNDGHVMVDATDGLPVVKIRNYQRKTSGSRTVASCTGATVTHNEEIFKITKYREVGVQIPWTSMQALCGDAATVSAGGLASDGTRYAVDNTPIMEDVNQRVMAVMMGLVSDINGDLTTSLALQAGRNRRTGLATAKNYEFFDPTGRALNAVGYAEMKTDYKTMGLGGTPIVIGGAKLDIFGSLMNWGNLAASGTDYSKMASSAPVRPYYDFNADTILGADQFLILAPGAAKLVTYNKFQGIYKRRFGTGNFGQFTIREFGTDLRFDLHIEEESCPDQVATIIISLHYDVYVPKNVFAVGDPNYAVNGITKGKIVNAAA